MKRKGAVWKNLQDHSLNAVWLTLLQSLSTVVICSGYSFNVSVFLSVDCNHHLQSSHPLFYQFQEGCMGLDIASTEGDMGVCQELLTKLSLWTNHTVIIVNFIPITIWHHAIKFHLLYILHFFVAVCQHENYSCGNSMQVHWTSIIIVFTINGPSFAQNRISYKCTLSYPLIPTWAIGIQNYN